MRSLGKSDILFLIFFADMTVLMLYGMSELLSYTYIHGGMVASSITLKNMFVYFYYPPKNILSLYLPIPFFAGIGVLFALYLYIFYYNYRTTANHRGKNPLDSPIGYIAGIGSLIYFLSIVLVLFQDALGAPISAKGITEIENTEPVFFYFQLIYAPFVEELEFRILPIGIYLAIRYYLQKRDYKIWEVFLVPGKLMKKFHRKLDLYDWIMIFGTSILFGYAHYAYGDWSLSKIPQAALGGFAFAIGFMIFGPFVDIPMHFLFDGTFTVDILPYGSAALSPIIIGIVLVFICAIITIILIIIRYTKNKMEGNEEPSIQVQ
jgi:hypothetical protein